MGNEMGNNNTSGFKEEENTKAEAPEISLLEGGGDDVKPDEDAKFHQKEASSGYDDADRVNGDHHVTTKIAKDEEEDNVAYKPAEFQVISEKSTDGTKENSEVQTTSKESETSVLNLEKNGMDTNGHKHERQASNSEEQGEEDCNLKTILASDDPMLEKISDNECIKHELQETKAGQLVEDCNESPRECKDAPRLRSKHTDHQADDDQVDSEKTTNTNQCIDTDGDIDKEKKGEGGKGSDWNTAVLASDDPKSEKILDLKCIQHELPETKAEALVESSDGSPQEHDHALGSGFKYTDDENGHLKDTEKSTNMDKEIGAETGADVEKNEDPLIEPKSCHDCIMSAAKNIDTQEGETIMDLISNNPSSSQPEDSLVVLSPNIPVQDSEERCTVLREETQPKEEPSEIGTIVQDNISTQLCEISNEFQGEYNKVGLNFEIKATDSVIKINKQTEASNKVSDGENLDTAEQGTAILTSSVSYCKHENKEMVETTEISTLTKSKFTTNPINEQSAITFPIPTFDKEDQESPRRTNNESNSDHSIVHHEMRKSPSFNIDIQSEGKGEDSEKTPLLYQIKTIENSPNPMEKRIVRSVSDKFKTSSFLGFEKEKTETQIEITKLNQDKSVENLDRKVKRRSKSSIFGNCICCATAIN